MATSVASFVAVASATVIAATSSADTLPSPSPTHAVYYHGVTPPGGVEGPNGDDNSECRLLGPFSILVQASLGLLALLSLVFKRWRERPQRPIKVWAFDVSKQVFGSAMLHLANLLMSMFSAGQLEIHRDYKPNPCSFYLLNLGIDVSCSLLDFFGLIFLTSFQTTLGIPILILALRILNFLASYTPIANPPESIESGNYGHPPRAGWWLKQSVIYFLGLLNMKVCVFFLIQFLPFIVKVGDWALKWTEGNTALQITFVMLLFPVCMNAIQYYIIDTFIKKPLSYDMYSGEERGDAVADEDLHRREGLLAGIDEADASDEDLEVEPRKSKPKDGKDTVVTESENVHPGDESPVPPYEPPSSSSSANDQDDKRPGQDG